MRDRSDRDSVTVAAELQVVKASKVKVALPLTHQRFLPTLLLDDNSMIKGFVIQLN